MTKPWPPPFKKPKPTSEEIVELARKTLSQGDDWLPYEETWHPIAVGLLAAEADNEKLIRDISREIQRRETAEAQNATLEEALVEIACQNGEFRTDIEMQKIARAVLPEERS